METWSDEELAARVRQGDQNAFRVLVDRYKTLVYAWLYRQVGDREVAEELAQDVFYNAYRGMSSYRGDAAFSTWLYRLVQNKIVDYRRAKKRWPLALPALVKSMLNRFADRRLEPEQQMLEKEEQDHLLRVVQELPELYREVVLLHYVDGWSSGEIAKLLLLPVKTVETRLLRGRTMLRKRWTEVNQHDAGSSQRAAAAAGPPTQTTPTGRG